MSKLLLNCEEEGGVEDDVRNSGIRGLKQLCGRIEFSSRLVSCDESQSVICSNSRADS